MIGNSRWHWAEFRGQNLGKTWHTPAWGADQIQRFAQDSSPQTLWLASVVPPQTQLWQHLYPGAHLITPSCLPITGLYPGLGVDRALGVWAAIVHSCGPALVVDVGTAITLTGVRPPASLTGGAILPGLHLQLRALHQGTAQLPSLAWPDQAPPRWSLSTETAMAGGIFHTVLAGLKDFLRAWLGDHPDSQLYLTGGDGAVFWSSLRAEFAGIRWEPDLVLWGLNYARPHYRRRGEKTPETIL